MVSSQRLTKSLVSLLADWRDECRHQQITVHPITLKPYAPPDVYPPPAPREEIKALSGRMGRHLSGDIDAWLSLSNGPLGFFGTTSAQEGRRIEEVWEFFPEWEMRGWVPIGRDVFGNYYVKSVPEESPVCFVDAFKPDVFRHAVASDALHFAFFSLLERKSLNEDATWKKWPYEKGFVLHYDPNLDQASPDYEMPWDSL